MIGCGAALAVFFVLALLTNIGIGEPSRNDPGVFIFMFLIAGGLIFGGYTWRKNNLDSWKKDLVTSQTMNSRVDNAWYCARCDVRFDSRGEF